MRHSLFDKIFLGFLFLYFVFFGILTFFTARATRAALIEERISILNNEAFLIGEQSVSGYMNGLYSINVLKTNLDYYSQTLNVSIWVLDQYGNVKASSCATNHPSPPENVHNLDKDFDLSEMQHFTGTFYELYDTNVITVALPIKNQNNTIGMVILHSTASQISNVQKDIFQVVYIPFLVLLVISFSLLGLISGKIMKPIKRINAVAEEYSTGNFDSKMDIHSNDEIGQLASTLEYMADELSKLDEYRKDFISNISHDFRSPLTSIKGYIEAIQDGTIPPDKQGKYLDIVLNETKRLTKLTSGLLQLNNFDSYGLWLVMKDFNIVNLVKNAMNTFEGKCEEKGIDFVLVNHVTSPYVTADKTKIQQVIYNLVDNAIKFTPTNRSIYITLTEKNDKITVSVKDEGCGIPKDSLNKIWVRFYKADVSRGKDKQGTGLGLAITKEIIKAHNENIHVVSTEGIGSTFTFTLAKSNSDKYNPATEELSSLN